MYRKVLPLALIILFASNAFALKNQRIGNVALGGFYHKVFENINFEDSLMMISEFQQAHYLPGADPFEGLEKDVEDTVIINPYYYEYDSLQNIIRFRGFGPNTTLELDDQKRITKITETGITTIFIEYSENRMVVQEHPNTPVLNRHSKEWDYRFRDDGQYDMVLITLTDWEHNGPIEWARDNADTIQYYYDDNGVRTGMKRVSWEADLFRNFPWRRSEDSLQYHYGSLDDGRKTKTILSLSPRGDEWRSVPGDTIWEYTYNEDGEVETLIRRRFSQYSHEWDQDYFTEILYSYKDGRLTERLEYLNYGSNENRRRVLRWEQRYTYGPNSLLPAKETSIATVSKDISPILHRSPEGLHIGNSSVDELKIYSISGQILYQTTNRTIPNEMIPRNQLLILEAKSVGRTLFFERFIY